jgi:hypothetical protein
MYTCTHTYVQVYIFVHWYYIYTYHMYVLYILIEFVLYNGYKRIVAPTFGAPVRAWVRVCWLCTKYTRVHSYCLARLCTHVHSYIAVQYTHTRCTYIVHSPPIWRFEFVVTFFFKRLLYPRRSIDPWSRLFILITSINWIGPILEHYFQFYHESYHLNFYLG